MLTIRLHNETTYADFLSKTTKYSAFSSFQMFFFIDTDTFPFTFTLVGLYQPLERSSRLSEFKSNDQAGDN